MAFNLATVLGFIFVSGIALFVFILVGWLVRPKKPNPIKGSVYECAEAPFGSAWFNFNNRFYTIALVFVAFDVEIVLVAPVVVVFRKLVAAGHGWLAFAEIFFFLAVLFVALIYVWARGDLSWVRTLTAARAKDTATGRKE
jgi:NADH-quinone oxidoreductase subunit A